MCFIKIFCSPSEVHWLTPDKQQKGIIDIKAVIFLKQKVGVNVLVFSEMSSDTQ